MATAIEFLVQALPPVSSYLAPTVTLAIGAVLAGMSLVNMAGE
jgi:hypothetical protein